MRNCAQVQDVAKDSTSGLRSLSEGVKSTVQGFTDKVLVGASCHMARGRYGWVVDVVRC